MNSGSGGNLQLDDDAVATENGTPPSGEVAWKVRGAATLVESAVMVKLICDGLTAIVCDKPVPGIAITAQSRNAAWRQQDWCFMALPTASPARKTHFLEKCVITSVPTMRFSLGAVKKYRINFTYSRNRIFSCQKPANSVNIGAAKNLFTAPDK